MNSLNEIVENIKTDLYLVKSTLPKTINEEDHLSKSGLESLDMIELIARIEYRYQIPIEDVDWKKLHSINLIADYIFKKLNKEYA